MQLDNETLTVVQDLSALHGKQTDTRLQDSLMRAIGRLLAVEFDPKVAYSYSGIELGDDEVRYYMYDSLRDSNDNTPAVVYTVNLNTGAYTKTGKTK